MSTKMKLTMEQLHHRFASGRFRVKIKSLAAESRIIRYEERRVNGLAWLPDGLRRHRIDIVGVEQRHTLLAYAMHRGLSFSQVEAKCRYKPDAQKVHRILRSLAVSAYSLKDVENWLQRVEAV